MGHSQKHFDEKYFAEFPSIYVYKVYMSFNLSLIPKLDYYEYCNILKLKKLEMEAVMIPKDLVRFGYLAYICQYL